MGSPKFKIAPSRLLLELSKYGMLIITLLLCVLFSFWTRPKIPLTGADYGEALARVILKGSAPGPKVVIVAPKQQEEFVAALDASLREGGAQILGKSVGNKTAGMKLVAELAKQGQTVDVLACNEVTRAWMFTDKEMNQPNPIVQSLGNPQVIIPPELPPKYGWPTFLSVSNAINIATFVSVTGIIAIGMTLVIITGGIDLSVGSLVALCGVIAALLIRSGINFSFLGTDIRLLGGSLEATRFTMIVSSLMGIAVCGLFGLATGLLVTKCKLPAFIVTLSFMLIARGIAKDLTKSESVYQIPESFIWLGRGVSVWHIPNAVILMFALYAVAYVLMHYTVLGRYLYAVGGNSEAARLSGVPVVKVILFAYVLCGILAGVGGIVEASRSKSGSATFGIELELKAIAAVVVGGTSIAGGEGKILGTLVGAFMIAVIESGMNQSHIPPEKQPIVLGAVILGAVLLDKFKTWLVRRSTSSSD